MYGGIGNQLFIYAASRRLALKNNAELIIDDQSGCSGDHKYKRKYELDCFNFNVQKISTLKKNHLYQRLSRNYLKILNKFIILNLKSYLKEKSSIFDQRILSLKLKNNVYLDGYWQSEDYFRDIEDILRNDLVFKTPSDRRNERIKKMIKESNSVAVHYRFFDIDDASSMANNLAPNYYSNAISEIEKIGNDHHYFIFSEDPSRVKLDKIFNKKKFTIIRGNSSAYIDLWLMSMCKNFIIANSTFSWWGAWLSDYPQKIIIAPDPLSLSKDNHWRSENLLPKSWIKVA